MRLGCLLPLVAIVLVIGGGQSVYTGLKNRKPTEIDIKDFIAKKPDNEWLIIKGGVLDTTNSAYTSGFASKEVQTIYVPLVPPDVDSSEELIHVLVLTKDPGLLDFTNQARKFEEEATLTGSAEKFLIENMNKLYVARPVEGLVQFGIEADDKKTRKVRKLYGNLAKDAVILEEGERPSAAKGAGMLIAGLVLGGIPPALGGPGGTTARSAPRSASAGWRRSATSAAAVSF